MTFSHRLLPKIDLPVRSELVKSIIKTSWILFIILDQNTAKQKQT